MYDNVLEALLTGLAAPGQPTLQFAHTANLQVRCRELVRRKPFAAHRQRIWRLRLPK